METYFASCHTHAAHYITTLQIMDLCLETERLPGARVSRQLWEQGFLDMVGARAATVRLVEAEED